MGPMRTATVTILLSLALLGLGIFTGCSRTEELNLAGAKNSIGKLVEVTAVDVAEVRRGMPEGVTALVTALSDIEGALGQDPAKVRDHLERTRAKVQDLRVAKSTFFALADPNGVVARTDRDPDLMAGRNLFESFPELRGTLNGKVVETRGVMPEAAQVKGRGDGQWVMGLPIPKEGPPRALYVTGWSWSAYAYRLENAVRSQARSTLEGPRKEPLVYVYLVVENAVYGAPVSPDVNAQALAALRIVEQLKEPSKDLTRTLEITGRSFGLAAKLAPELGQGVAIALLWSET